jgi:hypothetical protein
MEEKARINYAQTISSLPFQVKSVFAIASGIFASLTVAACNEQDKAGYDFESPR